MPLDPESLYMQLGIVIQQMPDIPLSGPLPNEVHVWLGKAYALVKEAGDLIDEAAFKVTSDRLYHSRREQHVTLFKSILYRHLAVAELRAPVPVHGTYIPAGNLFDAMAAVGKIVQSATSDVLIIDPYMDEKALTDFVSQAPETIPIRLLADQQHHKATLKPAATRWASQFGAARPLEVKLTPPRTLHDRLIVVDKSATWVLTQSLNAFATRASASIVRSDQQTAALKVEAYEAMWVVATPI